MIEYGIQLEHSQVSRGRARPAIRVVSTPVTHPFIRALQEPNVDRLADPSGDDRRTPCFFDPSWLAANRRHFDVFHANFNFEYYGRKTLESVCDVLDGSGVPILFTAHDLRNPNHASPEQQDEQLGLWMERATRVTTLTAGAANAIQKRWGRQAEVIVHPPAIVPPKVMQSLRDRGRDGERKEVRVGIHFKSLRPNMFRTEILGAVESALENVPGLHFRIDVHHDVLDHRSNAYDPNLMAACMRMATDRNSRVDVHIHHFFTEQELWAYIAELDGMILPYRFGTHSGLIAACGDLGTVPVVPDVGFYAEQAPAYVFPVSRRRGLDVDGFVSCMARLAQEPFPTPLDIEARVRERKRIASRYASLYRELAPR